MCDIGYHNCPVCGEEIKCADSNEDCYILNGFDDPCQKCEYWLEEELKEQERYELMMQERAEQERELYAAEEAIQRKH